MICRHSLGEEPCHAPSLALNCLFGRMARTMIYIRIGASTSSAADPTTRPLPSSQVKCWEVWKASTGLMLGEMRARWVSRTPLHPSNIKSMPLFGIDTSLSIPAWWTTPLLTLLSAIQAAHTKPPGRAKGPERRPLRNTSPSDGGRRISRRR